MLGFAFAVLHFIYVNIYVICNVYICNEAKGNN